jgi:hypothetical protein
LSFLALKKVVYNIRNHNFKKDSTQLECSHWLGALGMKNIWFFWLVIMNKLPFLNYNNPSI